MIEGTLQINLDPPYMGFHRRDSSHHLRSCSLEDLKSLLVELDAILPEHAWPPQDYFLSLPGKFSAETLTKFGLIQYRNIVRKKIGQVS